MFSTREEYLVALIQELRPMFDLYGFPLPQAIRITCGFPLNAKRSRAIGECFPAQNSGDNHFEILISPELADPQAVAECVIHELCHTTNGAMNHGATFKRIADYMGLVPSATRGYKATSGAVDFMSRYGAIIQSLGDYPHAQLSYATRKTQGTRMLKAMCACGYTIRLTSKWAFDEYGSPRLPACPIDGQALTLA